MIQPAAAVDSSERQAMLQERGRSRSQKAQATILAQVRSQKAQATIRAQVRSKVAADSSEAGAPATRLERTVEMRPT